MNRLFHYIRLSGVSARHPFLSGCINSAQAALYIHPPPPPLDAVKEADGDEGKRADDCRLAGGWNFRNHTVGGVCGRPAAAGNTKKRRVQESSYSSTFHLVREEMADECSTPVDIHRLAFHPAVLPGSSTHLIELTGRSRYDP